MNAAATHGGGQIVDLPDHLAITVGDGRPKRPGLRPGIRPEEVPGHVFELVVGEASWEDCGILEVDQMVAATLKDQHGKPGLGQNLGGRRPGRT